MKHPMKVDQSVVIQYNGKDIAVATLPEHIKNEILTLDRIKQDKLDILYNLEVLELASQAKIAQLNNILKAYFEPKVKTDEQPADL